MIQHWEIYKKKNNVIMPDKPTAYSKETYYFSQYFCFILFEAVHLCFADIPVPLSVQMLRLSFIISASGNITTTIGARFETAVSFWRFL